MPSLLNLVCYRVLFIFSVVNQDGSAGQNLKEVTADLGFSDLGAQGEWADGG